MACFYEGGLQFSCTRCSACCRHTSGYVFLSKSDIIKAAAYLSISEEEFLIRCCRQVHLSEGIRVSLTEKDNMDCIFWKEENGGCSIYPARPWQCQSYPFWTQLLNEQAWQREKSSCPGIDQGRLYTKRRNRPNSTSTVQ